MRIPLFPPFAHDGGHGYTVLVRKLARLADRPGAGAHSPVELFEDGRALGPAHTPHREIRELGRGRFSHWTNNLFFSASDNSDPNANGRSYELAVAEELAPLGDEAGGIQALAQWSLITLVEILKSLHLAPGDCGGMDVMEIGFGKDLGHALILCAMGARVTALEPSPPPYEDAFHGPFYESLAAMVREWDLPGWPVDRIAEVLLAGTHGQKGLSVVDGRMEELAERFPGNSFDLILSDAVLEHVRDLDAAMAGSCHCSRRGGLALHSVDFRDHLDFSRPREFFLMDDREYEAWILEKGTDRGTRLRFSDLVSALGKTSYLPLRVRDVLALSPAELDAFSARLKSEGKSARFRNADPRDLAFLSCRFLLKKI